MTLSATACPACTPPLTMQAIMLSVALLASTGGPMSFIVELPHPILSPGVETAAFAADGVRDRCRRVRLSQRDKPSDLL